MDPNTLFNKLCELHDRVQMLEGKNDLSVQKTDEFLTNMLAGISARLIALEALLPFIPVIEKTFAGQVASQGSGNAVQEAVLAFYATHDVAGKTEDEIKILWEEFLKSRQEKCDTRDPEKELMT